MVYFPDKELDNRLPKSDPYRVKKYNAVARAKSKKNKKPPTEEQKAKNKTYWDDQHARWAQYERDVASGLRTPKRQRHKNVFDDGEFVGVDGEGWDYGAELTLTIDNGHNKYGNKILDNVYTYRKHKYTLLAASDGTDIYNGGERLTTTQCLDYLFDVQRRKKLDGKRAILVAFAMSYDCNHMLMYDVPKAELKKIQAGDLGTYTGTSGYTYQIEYRPRKSLRVWRYQGDRVKFGQNKKGEWKKVADDVVTLWDTIGFFQDRYTEVMRKWLGDRDAEYEMICEMKNLRGDFENHSIRMIRYYNQAECTTLVRIMDLLRDAIKKLGLKITRWNGAGAIAAAMNAVHKVKESMNDTSDDVFFASRIAYSGGHIEAMGCGRVAGTVYHYDVASAYPSIFATLPSLRGGSWRQGIGEPPKGFTLVKTAWWFPMHDVSGEAIPFYPLFWRDVNGCILYPSSGVGWHWFSEWRVAREFAHRLVERYRDAGREAEADAIVFEVLEWWHYEPKAGSSLPFGWVRDYYKTRQEYVRDTKRKNLPEEERWKLGAEKIIKLGLNSLYGKTAQQIGGKADKKPTYFQMEWAGYVTAGCRSQLMEAALRNPGAILSFATDGIFSSADLGLEISKEKDLGCWELEKHSDFVLAMAGVYWYLNEGDSWTNYSRGFNKDDLMLTPHAVLDAWKTRWAKEYDLKLPVPTTRVVGLGSALASETLWKMRGYFATSTRDLSLNGGSKKRDWIRRREKPHLRWAKNYPAQALWMEHLFDRSMLDDVSKLEEFCSKPYPVRWIDDGALAESADADKEDDAEISDMEGLEL